MKFVASLAVYRVLLLRDQGLGQRTNFLEMAHRTMRPLLEEPQHPNEQMQRIVLIGQVKLRIRTMAKSVGADIDAATLC